MYIMEKRQRNNMSRRMSGKLIDVFKGFVV